MKLIIITGMSDRVQDTIYFDNCYSYGAIDSIEDKNEHDLNFEKFFRCKLILIDGDWYAEFSDEEFTWFMMRWS
jgi:hypothetical protein